MNGDGTFALVTVSRESAQMDDVSVREQFSGGQPVEEFIVIGKDRFDEGRMEQLQPSGTIAFVPINACITIAPQGARDHQVVHQIEARGIGVRLLNEPMARMVVLPLAAPRSTPIKVHRERSDRFREDPHASPNRREVQGALFCYILLVGCIGDRVGRDDLIDRRFEFGSSKVASFTPSQKRKPLHYRLLLSAQT